MQSYVPYICKAIFTSVFIYFVVGKNLPIAKLYTTFCDRRSCFFAKIGTQKITIQEFMQEYKNQSYDIQNRFNFNLTEDQLKSLGLGGMVLKGKTLVMTPSLPILVKV